MRSNPPYSYRNDLRVLGGYGTFGGQLARLCDEPAVAR